MHADQFITDPMRAELGRNFTDNKRMDVVLTAGMYTQVSMILNSFWGAVGTGRNA